MINDMINPENIMIQKMCVFLFPFHHNCGFSEYKAMGLFSGGAYTRVKNKLRNKKYMGLFSGGGGAYFRGFTVNI